MAQLRPELQLAISFQRNILQKGLKRQGRRCEDVSIPRYWPETKLLNNLQGEGKNSTHNLEWIYSHWLSQPGQKIGDIEWQPCDTNSTGLINQKWACLPASLSSKTRSWDQCITRKLSITRQVWVELVQSSASVKKTKLNAGEVKKR